MTDYIVSEDELQVLVNEAFKSGYTNNAFYNGLDLFLKDKEPVKLIEVGIVQGDFGYGLFDEYQGKKYEIYIKEV